MGLLAEFTQGDGLIKHALAVEAAMRAYARRFGENENLWGATGLLHDFDYERYPSAEEHPAQGAKILTERGYPEEVVYAIKAHADHMNLERKSHLDKTLYAVDELTGLITATALVHPTKRLAEVKVKSIKKKMKDKAFARSVDRDAIRQGADDLGVELEEHIDFVLRAMQDISGELGL